LSVEWDVKPQLSLRVIAVDAAHLVVDRGACVRECPPGSRSNRDSKCVECNGPCPKRKSTQTHKQWRTQRKPKIGRGGCANLWHNFLNVFKISKTVFLCAQLHYYHNCHIMLLGPFYGAIAVPSDTRCHCRRCRGHWCACATVATPGE